MNEPPEALPPPPRAVRYLPFVRTARIWWAIVLSVLVLIPVVCSLCGLTHAAIGGTPPSGNQIQIDAKVTGHSIDANGDASMTFQYSDGRVNYVHTSYVPQSYYGQMATSAYAPITIPDPSYPSQFHIGPPMGNPGIAFWQLYWCDAVLAVCLLFVCCYIEGRRAIEFNLLRHGYSALATVVLESRPEGAVQEVLKISTRQGEAEALVGYSALRAKLPPPGTQLPVLYSPTDPSTMKPLSEFKCCELV